MKVNLMKVLLFVFLSVISSLSLSAPATWQTAPVGTFSIVWDGSISDADSQVITGKVKSCEGRGCKTNINFGINPSDPSGITLTRVGGGSLSVNLLVGSVTVPTASATPFTGGKKVDTPLFMRVDSAVLLAAEAGIYTLAYDLCVHKQNAGVCDGAVNNVAPVDLEVTINPKVKLTGFTGATVTIDEATKQAMVNSVCIGTNNPAATGVQISATGAYTDSGGAKVGFKMGNAATTDTLDYAVKVNGLTLSGTPATLTSNVEKLSCATSGSSVIFDVTTDLTTVEAQTYAATVTVTVAEQ